MLIVFLIEFLIILLVSIFWAYLIDKTKDEDYNDTEFP